MRCRYWARSTFGWDSFSRARPNEAHVALAGLEAAGKVDYVITQVCALPLAFCVLLNVLAVGARVRFLLVVCCRFFFFPVAFLNIVLVVNVFESDFWLMLLFPPVQPKPSPPQASCAPTSGSSVPSVPLLVLLFRLRRACDGNIRMWTGFTKRPEAGTLSICMGETTRCAFVRYNPIR